jgi:hypothetical protein
MKHAHTHTHTLALFLAHTNARAHIHKHTQEAALLLLSVCPDVYALLPTLLDLPPPSLPPTSQPPKPLTTTHTTPMGNTNLVRPSQSSQAHTRPSTTGRLG